MKQKNSKIFNCSILLWWQSYQLQHFLNSSEKHITLLTYLLPCSAAHVPVTNSRRWGMDIWHELAVDSANDGERVLAPVYGPKEVILSSDDTFIEWAVIETEKRCSRFIECFFFKSVNNSQNDHKSSAQLCHRELAEQLQHFF